MNFDKAVYDELKESQFPPQLAPACRLASEQLEWLKPLATNVTSEGLYAGPVADVARGAILLVIANPKHILTVHMIPPSGVNLKALLNDLVDCVAANCPDLAHKPAAAASTLSAALKNWGGKPNAKTPAMDTAYCALVFGNALSILPPSQRAETVDWVVRCQNAGSALPSLSSPNPLRQESAARL